MDGLDVYNSSSSDEESDNNAFERACGPSLWVDSTGDASDACPENGKSPSSLLVLPTTSRYERKHSKRAKLDHPSNRVQVMTYEAAKTREMFIRSEPHIRGNWAGLVYFNISSDQNVLEQEEEQQHDGNASPSWKDFQLRSVQKLMRSSLDWKRTTAIVLHDEIHLSLTRTFYLQAAFLPFFLQSLGRMASEFSTFVLVLDTTNPIQFFNDSKSRIFWAWPVVRGQNTLLPWISLLDDLLQKYQQPAYYQPPHFHASFASSPLWDGWNEQNPIDEQPKGESSSSFLEVSVSKLYCRMGNQVHEFRLGPSHA